MSSQNNKINIKSILNITLRLFVVCTLIAAVVAGVNALTFKKIAENEQKVTDDTIRSVFSEGKIENLHFTNDSTSDSAVNDIYRIINEQDDSVLGYSVICSPNGFGGEVKIMVAFDAEKTISSVRVMSHSETPGIGDKITSADYSGFTEQFIGKNSELSFGSGVDKISGSTKSSNAVLHGVNDAVKAIGEID